MPYEMKVEGMDEISELLEELEKKAPAVAAQALYKGAHVMADEIERQIGSIKTAPFEYAKDGTRLPSPEEKEALVKGGIGIASFEKNGTEINTSVGFDADGYVDVNFRHMNAGARTNYKKKSLKGHASNSASFLRAMKIKTKGLQDQKPLAVIANAINSGTSFMKKQPFVRKAAKSGGPKAMAAMKEFIENELNAVGKT